MKKSVKKHKKQLVKLLYIQIAILSFLLLALPLSIYIYQKENPAHLVNVQDNYKFTEKENHYLDQSATVLNIAGEESNIKDIIKEDSLNDFIDIIDELILEKYPKFIVEEINKINTEVKYDFKESFLEVTFTNNIYEEVIKNDSLIISYSYLEDMFLINVNIDDNIKKVNGLEVNTNKKVIALTFDDGPVVGTTEKIINILKDNKSTATFYMLGLSMENNEEIIKKVSDYGNEIGLHGYSHRNFTRMGLHEVQEEINKANDILYRATGKYATQIRPPYGSINSNITSNLNYSYIIWNVDTDDWRFKNPDQLVNHVLENVEDGDIVLFHDIYETSALAIEKLLPELYLRGYEVVDVSTLAKIKNQEISNNQIYGSFK